IRLAGTWKQYSKKAMPQLAMMTFQRASLRYFRWPYHAKVMKIFEMVRSRMVRTNPPRERDAAIERAGKMQSSRNAGRPETANINCFVHNFLINQPIASTEKAMPAEAAFPANGVHLWAGNEQVQPFDFLRALPFG